MIINLRGTNGSGKSTVVREIMLRFGARAIPDLRSNKPIVYELPLPRPLFVLGRYKTACGGCDTIKTVQEVIDLIKQLNRPEVDILFEGILISTTYGAVGVLSEQYKEEFIFAFMDTSLDECERRVRTRRAAADNLKPFDASGLRSKFKVIERVRQKLIGSHRRVELIRDYKDMAKLLGVEVLL